MNTNFGLIALTVLATLGIVVIIIAAVWFTFLAKEQQGRHDAFVDKMNAWMTNIANHFNDKHDKLVQVVAADVAGVKQDVSKVSGVVYDLHSKVADVIADAKGDVEKSEASLKDMSRYADSAFKSEGIVSELTDEAKEKLSK